MTSEYLTKVNNIVDTYNVPSQPAEGNNTTYSKGDVNNDGRISPADYVLIRNHITGQSNLTGDAEKAADVNRDGRVSPADYVLIRNHITDGVAL